jgi:two-component system response regulator GlrR
MQKEIEGFAPEAMQQLLLYGWPGNVRELANVVERAVVLALHGLITPDLLLLGRPAVHSPKSELPLFKEARAAFERSYLVQILTATRGNVSRAAELSGRHRAELYKLLRKYGVDPGTFKDVTE